jgi:hypothetical protein
MKVWWLITKEGDYELQRVDIKIPEGVSARDYLFKQNSLQLIKTNHDDQIAVVSSEKGIDLALSYEEVKAELRQKMSQYTIFPLVENCTLSCLPLGQVVFERRWTIAITPKNENYFFGDAPRLEMQPVIKDCMFAIMPVIVVGTSKKLLLFVPIDDSERVVMADNAKIENMIFEIRGMFISRSVAKNQSVEEWVIVSKIHFVREKFEDIGSVVACVNSVNDVSVWRDHKTGVMVPSEVEAAIVTSALFFCVEGFATFNMLVIGRPGTGKTHQADVFGHLMGTTLHNMEQSTLKGLVFSHQGDSAKSGFGQKGILLRERYVALLNEFLRVVVRSQQKAAHKDEMSRLFATLNDAVERKKNRSRSSGNVVDAEGYCSCSMLTTDNDFPHLIGPFAHTMLEDPSYLRRYSILRLSDETETRGEFAKVGVFDWQSALTHHLASKGLAGGRWARLMRFWRSQVPVALKKFDYLNIARYAKVKKKMLLRKWFYGDREPVSFGGVDQTAILYQTVMQADFSQLAVSCQASAIIMGSTFRSKGSYPELTRTHDDDVLATRMITRLMEDLFKVIGPYIAEHIQMNEGVRRI